MTDTSIPRPQGVEWATVNQVVGYRADTEDPAKLVGVPLFQAAANHALTGVPPLIPLPNGMMVVAM